MAGKLSTHTVEFIEGDGKVGDVLIGKEKFCINQNLSGLPSLGAMEMGEVWKGPIKGVSEVNMNGPMYLSLSSSFYIVFSKPST